MNMKPTTILLVEDNQKLAAYILDYLEKAGFSVSHQTRGDKAVYQILQTHPDLVILDIMLPGFDGVQVCQLVRSSYRGFILMLTALGENEDQLLGFESGADDYVIKPIDPEILLARIKALQRRQLPQAASSLLKFSQLSIDMVNRSVMLAKEKILLKPQEFELLLFLAKNADHVINRDNIMQTLRGISYDGIDRTIDLRISYLRKKLHDNVLEPFRIKTIRGKGYIFISTAWK